MKIEKLLKKFLDQNADRQKPLVCALSGGVDSMCLYYLLKKCPKYLSNMSSRKLDGYFSSINPLNVRKL